jgi:predicted nuclease with TOPRIM domain
METPDSFLEWIVSLVLGGGLFAGLWDYLRTKREGTNNVQHKKVIDESRLNEILLEHNMTTQADFKESLVKQIEELRQEANDFQRRISDLMNEAVEREKMMARLEIENEQLRAQIVRLEGQQAVVTIDHLEVSPPK